MPAAFQGGCWLTFSVGFWNGPLDGAECRIWLEEEFPAEIPGGTAERLLIVQNVVGFIELEIKRQAVLVKAWSRAAWWPFGGRLAL